MADRHGPLRTPVGRFVETVNGGKISDGAAIAAGTEIGTGPVSPTVLAGDGTVEASNLSVLAPAGLRGGESRTSQPGSYLTFVSGFPQRGLERGTVEYREGKDPVLIDATEFIPSTAWGQTESDDRTLTWETTESGVLPPLPFLPGWDSAPADLSAHQFLVVLAEGSQFREVFGQQLAQVGGRRIEPGDPIDLRRTTLVGVGRELIRWEFTEGFEDLFAVGRPAPLGGATVGIGVLATPTASIAGQEANPLVGMDTVELLQHEGARDVLRRAGVTDAEEIEWIDAPGRQQFADAGQTTDAGEYDPPTLLDEPAQVETVTGIVSGQEAPWGVGVHVARATPDDHVVAIGVQRWPVGTSNAAVKTGDTTLFDNSSQHLYQGREYVMSVVDQLVVETAGTN